MDLFPEEEKRHRTPRAPLAERMRPRTFEDFVGQSDLLKPGSLLRSAVERGELPSLIFWGPPGSGKTTLARLIAHASGSHFVAFSAVTSGVKEVREVIARAGLERKARGTPTLLFVDEIHRFNKAQQDAFLPHVEDGTIVLMGATTENPSFEVNNALLAHAGHRAAHARRRGDHRDPAPGGGGSGARAGRAAGDLRGDPGADRAALERGRPDRAEHPRGRRDDRGKAPRHR
jgi:putative ATPase